VDKLLLLGRDVLELTVRSLEKGHSEWQVYTHYPELGVAGDDRPNRDACAANQSEEMQQCNRGEHQR
jgi:hypothetical protein